jgi:hypothetical protein
MKQLIFTLLVLTTLVASADKTTRKGLKVAKPTRIEAADTTALDTIALSPGMITLAGYDKPLRSNKESIYLTNATRRRLSYIEIEITYFDESGRQLHKRTVSQTVDIPAGETRQLTFASWDKQRNMYYTLSGKPRTSNGTPYTISARATRAIYH